MNRLNANQQNAICQRFGSAFVVPAATDKLGIALQTLDLLPLTAVRLKPENGTCGWYIHGGEYAADDDFYQPLHVVHLAELCPQILPYLALAPGFKVMLAPDFEDVWYEDIV